jgi:hypothetical protein
MVYAVVDDWLRMERCVKGEGAPGRSGRSRISLDAAGTRRI